MKFFLLFTITATLFLTSCKKQDFEPLQHGYGVEAYFNDKYKTLESITATSYLDCDFVSVCPYIVNGQTIDSLCVLEYSSTIVSDIENMALTITYRLAVDAALISSAGNRIHNVKDSILNVFKPQIVKFATDSNDLGIIVELEYLDALIGYSTLKAPIDSINTNDYYFEFTKQGFASTGESQTYPKTYEIVTWGTFECKLYSNLSTMVHITDGKFKMIFCE